MTLDIQYKIKSNPNYLRFLRENSQWYKYLNRDRKYFKDFEEAMKETYSLRLSDRISSTIKTLELLENVISSLK
jgi:hypothetical protein